MIELCVGAVEFWGRMRDDVARAVRRVWVQTLSFEGDSAGLGLAEALLQTKAPDRRIAVDSFTRWIVSDRFVWSPAALFDAGLRREVRTTAGMIADLAAAGVGIVWTNPVGPFFVRFPARNHKKIIVVDDVAYFGGINFSEHNFAWHDVMFRVEDPEIAAFLASDFEATFGGRDVAASRNFDGIAFHLLDGRSNEARFAEVLPLIDAARREIVVESPYLTFPVADHIGAAATRGVRVRVITPALNNWRIFDDYVVWLAGKSGIELLRFPGMTHVKAILIDDTTLLVGSCNFDYLSYRCHQELIAVVTDPRVVAETRARLFEPDLAVSVPCRRRVGNLLGRLRRAQLELFGDLSALVTVRPPR